MKTNQDIELNACGSTFDNFVHYMKKKIEDGTEKHGDFTQWNKADFLDGLTREYRELMEAIVNHKSDAEIASECVDVANLAYMLYYSYTRELLALSKELAHWRNR